MKYKQTLFGFLIFNAVLSVITILSPYFTYEGKVYDYGRFPSNKDVHFQMFDIENGVWYALILIAIIGATFLLFFSEKEEKASLMLNIFIIGSFVVSTVIFILIIREYNISLFSDSNQDLKVGYGFYMHLLLSISLLTTFINNRIQKESV